MLTQQTARRVAARYQLAKAIGGDLKATLAKWRELLDEWAAEEKHIPAALAAPPGTEKTNSDAITFLYFVTRSLYRLERLGLQSMMLGILQQYDLDNVDRSKIEEAARYMTKRGIRDPRSVKTCIPAYRKTLAMYLDWYKTVEQVLKAGKLRGTEDNGTSVITAGSFKVVNTGGFDDETMKMVAAVVKKAEQLLTAKGLGKVCYGEILVSQQVHKDNWAAFYRSDADEMFVRADLKRSEHDLHTVIHELGHRLMYKFLAAKKRQITLMYGRIKRGQKAEVEAAIEAIVNDPANHPKPGERAQEPNGKWFTVTEVKPGYLGMQVHMQLDGDPKANYKFGVWDYLRRYRGVKLPPVKASDFVTDYAGTTAVENFAEMIAFYCLDKLPDDQLAMLLPILG